MDQYRSILDFLDWTRPTPKFLATDEFLNAENFLIHPNQEPADQYRSMIFWDRAWPGPKFLKILTIDGFLKAEIFPPIRKIFYGMGGMHE